MGCDGSVQIITGSCTGAVPFVVCCDDVVQDAPTRIIYFEVDYEVDDPDIAASMMGGFVPPFVSRTREFGGVIPPLDDPGGPPEPGTTTIIPEVDPPPTPGPIAPEYGGNTGINTIFAID